MWLQMKIDSKQVDGEQRRKNMEEEAKQAKYKAEYQVRIKCFGPNQIIII